MLYIVPCSMSHTIMPEAFRACDNFHSATILSSSTTNFIDFVLFTTHNYIISRYNNIMSLQN